MSERELTPSRALTEITNSIQALGLKALVRYVGAGDMVAIAELYDNDKKLIESGAGKGPDALIGALAESLEHYGTFHCKQSQRSGLSCDVIAAQQDAQCDGLLASLPSTGESLECFRLTALDDEHELFVPCILLHPDAGKNETVAQETRFLSRYASNSGIAFGCTKAEALLHGALEVIERHLLSRFFLAVCAIRPAMDLYTPSKALLAQALLHRPYALEAASKLQIIIIRDESGVYFSVAFPKMGPGDLHISPIGSGCSLDICIAVQRAVTEQFQSSTLYDVSEEASDRKTFDMLSSCDALKNLIDFAPVKNLKLRVLEPFSKKLTSSVTQQIELLQRKLKAIDRAIFHRTVAQYSNTNIVIQTYIPGLDRFNIIRNGQLVAPQHILLNKTKTSAPDN
ncbi:YcaO-like family protein [Pseudomonas sp. NPDC087639]|uniref:YcaO-like family protein n=1 Tax=Pseudomonas sp. NPDC087639 TaxID=3364445 RepID=UPI00383056AA